MRRLFFLAILCLQALGTRADVVKGRVIDSESNEPLEGAIIELWKFPLGDNWVEMDKLETDSLGTFSNEVSFMARVEITINYFGYNQLKKKVNVKSGKDTLDLGDLKLGMSPELLKEIEVKGHAKRFYMKGDTVVFNPDAFHLEDGDRVATLLKKLPGVNVKDGQLTFMGKEVHLMVNGQDVADDLLTAQLPVEAVQNIEAYERKSELAELSGMDDGQEQQVLNIVVKPGFMDKWYGQAKLSAYASPNYRAQANMHYLTAKDPVNLFVRASDNGSSTFGVYGDNDYEWGSTPTRQQFGKLSYQHNWKPKNVESSYDQDRWAVSTSPEHLDTHQHSWVNEETFLSGQPSTFSNSHSHSYKHSLSAPLNFGTNLHLSPRTTLTLEASGGYKKGETRSSSELQTYRGDKYSANPQNLVNSRENKEQSQTEQGDLHTFMYLRHVWEKSDLYVQFITDYTHSKDNTNSHSEYEYHNETGDGTNHRLEALDQDVRNRANNFTSIFDTKYSFQIIPKKLKAGAGYWFAGQRSTSQSHMVANGLHDLNNSYDRQTGLVFNEPRIEMESDLGRVWMLGRIKLANSDETLDYQRGKLDTVIHHNTWFPRPHLEMRWKSSNTTELKAKADWEHETANLLESSAYVDNSNPLYITLGNPGLKGTSNLNANLAYNLMFMKGEQMLSLNMGYQRTFDPATRISAYNEKTGAYLSSTMNVADNDRWSTDIMYDRSLGEALHLKNKLNYAHAQTHGMKTTTFEGETPLLTTLNGDLYCQTGNEFGENLNVSFENKTWEASAYGSVIYSSLSYTDPALSGQNLWNYILGLKGDYKLEHWTFNLVGELIGNRGYLSDLMNRNRFSLDASITWKFLKSKAQLMLTAKDILNQMDRNSASVSPTQIVENNQETFHRYLALTFTYNLDAKAPKKQGGM